MKPSSRRIIRINLLVLLATAVVLGLAARFTGQLYAILFGLFYVGQAVTNFILGLAHIDDKPEEPGVAPYFLSMLLVLMIGFGTCSSIAKEFNLEINS